MQRRRVPLTLTLDPATIEAARKAAAADGRSVSGWVDRVLAAALRLPSAGLGPDLADLIAAERTK